MALYLEKAIFVNRAPFENIELNFKEKGINVLAAINGRGKTTILSHITDAFYELAKDAFQNTFELLGHSFSNTQEYILSFLQFHHLWKRANLFYGL